VRNRPLLQMAVVGLIAVVIGIPVALVIPWFPHNAARQAGNVKTLYDVLLIASVPIFVLVETVVLYSVWRFRMRPGEENKDGPPIHGNTRLEVVWTAVPAILIVGLCTYAYTVLRSNENSKKNEITVNVTERQFAFEFSYPQSGGKTIVSSELYLPKGQPVVFKLRSLDVIHSFFVPDFSVKLDAVPGIATTLRVTPTRLGVYPAECTELCGAGHALMRAPVHIVAPATFQSWLRSQQANTAPPIGSPPPEAAQPGVPGAGAAPAPSTSTSTTSSAPTPTLSASAQAGKAVFTGAAGCSTCHTLAAAGASGTVGPDLGTKVVPDSKTRKLPLKQFIFESITKPNAFISSGFGPNIMPQNFSQSLGTTKIQELVDFIASVTK
jgi:cytochrome c oxidase subunit II